MPLTIMDKPKKSDYWDKGIFMEKTFINKLYEYIDHLENNKQSIVNKTKRNMINEFENAMIDMDTKTGNLIVDGIMYVELKLKNIRE